MRPCQTNKGQPDLPSMKLGSSCGKSIVYTSPMAFKAWKQFETSPGYQRLKVKAKRLVGQELRLTPEVEVDCANDGGWDYDASLLDEFSIVYSLGVGDYIDFDLGLIKRCQSNVYAFDPTPTSQAFVESEDERSQMPAVVLARGVLRKQRIPTRDFVCDEAKRHGAVG